ncbi:uncharacterized protein [Montipora capricornis]|uniref:uncharacterized protein n=1 Tax=Montipora capricornis TaxID=246305 RepID=UPI0035F108E9
MGSSDILCISTMRGSVNGDKFIQFLQDDLVPMLQPFDGMNLNSIVVTDNAAIHHVPWVSDILEGTGALLIYLPPYSPDYNPLEELLSKVKGHIRKNDVVFQATDNPEAFIIESFHHVTSQDCNNYFQHPEYI